MHHSYFTEKLKKILKNGLEILDNTVKHLGLIHLQMLEPNDNTGLADLGAINELANNNALCAINVNQFRGGALRIRNTVPANNNAITTPLVPAHTPQMLPTLM
ncbi:8168_t:CDS:2 [Acaulospora morrowiae]|uniref:8168_t:CDS:1 n=1 Tax=Acaulospora morrowiae TaxID=94023 RepID=A0A9N8Z6W9_9GLOM|nr:8168_t:CDS:2 [Acaulospora morrowiae]